MLFRSWRETLPVGGVAGTLARRFHGTLLEGKLFAKTGTLNATNAISGYMIAKSGKTLWQFQTGSGVNAQPVTFTRNGRQYVTVLSGIGGVYRNQAGNELKNVPPGGSVWTFALMPE